MDAYFEQLRQETAETVAAQQLQQCTLYCEIDEYGPIRHSDDCPNRRKR